MLLKNATPQNIILIGMPGAGKTTLGYALAEQLSWGHVDTDCLMESWWGLHLQAIREHLGLEGFLDAEADLIEKTNLNHCIISTGGSVIYRDRAMQSLRQKGKIVYLHTSLPTLEKRLTNMDTRGIAIRPDQTLAQLYTERSPLYTKYCDLELDTDRPLSDCLQQLVSEIKKWKESKRAGLV